MNTIAIIIGIIIFFTLFVCGFIWFVKITDILCSNKLNKLEKEVKDKLSKL